MRPSPRCTMLGRHPSRSPAAARPSPLPSTWPMRVRPSSFSCPDSAPGYKAPATLSLCKLDRFLARRPLVDLTGHCTFCTNRVEISFAVPCTKQTGLCESDLRALGRWRCDDDTSCIIAAQRYKRASPNYTVNTTFEQNVKSEAAPSENVGAN